MAQTDRPMDKDALLAKAKEMFYQKYMKPEGYNISDITSIASFGFSADDFTDTLSASSLVKAINASGILTPDGNDDIDKLNRLLKRKGLHKEVSNLQLPVNGLDVITRQAGLSENERTQLNRQVFEMAHSLSREVVDLINREAGLSENELIQLNRLVLERAYPQECPKHTDMNSSVINEIDGHLLYANDVKGTFAYVIQVLNSGNQLCGVYAVGSRREQEIGEDGIRSQVYGSPGTEEMLMAIKNNFFGRYKGDFESKRYKAGGLTAEDQDKLKAYQERLVSRSWVWKKIRMYDIKLNIKLKPGFSQGLVGGELLFLDTGENVYNSRIDLAR